MRSCIQWQERTQWQRKMTANEILKQWEKAAGVESVAKCGDVEVGKRGCSRNLMRSLL